MADPLLNPSELDFDSSPVDFALAQRRWAQSQAIQSLDDSADDAGRADQMARSTGAHPALVYGDLENFEHQYRATLTSNILEHNQYLRDYVASHPLAAKVSNDDWGQLDSYTGALSKVLVGKDMMSLASTAMKGFKEGWDEDGFGQEFDRTVHNLLGNGAIANTFLSLVKVNPAYYAPRIMQGLLYAGARAGPDFLFGQTGNEAMKTRATRDLLIMPQVAIPELAGGVIPAELNALARAAQKGEPWAKMGRFPHPGYDPDSDAIHKEQTKFDMDRIDDAHKELQSSPTLRRSPELASLVGRIVTDGKIDLSAEAVRKLYGGKPGEPIEVKADDKLGFIPNLQEQLALAEKYGGDVTVPLSEWNARSGDLHDELREFIRPRADGMTLEDTKAEAPKVEEPVGPVAPVDALRQNAGLAQPQTLDLRQALDRIATRQQLRAFLPLDAREITTATSKSGEGETRAAWGSYTFPVKSLLEHIDTSELTDGPQILQTFFGDHIREIAGDVPVEVVPLNQLGKLYGGKIQNPFAFYSTYSNKVFLPEELWLRGYKPNEISHVVMEETSHAATLRALLQNDELNQKVRTVRDYLNQYMKDNPEHVEKYRDRHYGNWEYARSNPVEMLAWAQSHEKFQRMLMATPISDELRAKIGMGDHVKTVFDTIQEVLRTLLKLLTGKDPDPTVMDAMLHLSAETKKIMEELGGPQALLNKDLEPATPEVTPGSPTDIENRIRGLMPKGLLDRYMEKIGKQQEEDAAFQEKQARKRAEETQTKEWKQTVGEMKDKVRGEMQNRADIAADRLFRIGQIFGKKVGKVTLDPKYLTDEQKASLPKEYIGKGGENPDAIAAPFGYTTGDQLVTALARIKAEREMEGLTPQAHFNKLVDAETDRRMRLEHGTLDEAIVKEMEDHVISPTQFDLLHDKMLALGMASKTNEPLESLPNMRKAIKEAFATSDWASHSSAKYTAASLRAFGRLRDAALKDDIYGMFKAQQEQIHALLLADEAKKLEKENVRDDKLIKKYSARAPKNTDPETANFIQEVLMKTFGVMRTRDDLLRQRGLITKIKDLQGFVDMVNSDDRIFNQDPNAMTIGQRIPIPEFLLDPEYKTDLDNIKVDERRAIMNTIRAMDKYGKEINTYNVRGKKEALQDVLDGLQERLKAAMNYNKLSKSPEQATSVFRLFGSYTLTPETWFNRLDLGNRRGPFNQLIMRPIAEGQYGLKTLERQFSKEWRDVGEAGDLRKKVDNPLFRDRDGDLLELNKGHVLSILSNMGNELQRRKLTVPYGIDHPDKVWNWLFSLVDQGILSKEDFDRAGRMGKFFERIFEKAEVMYSGLTGVTPERIPLGSIKTPWGDMDEWYHPLIRDPIRSSPAKASDMYEESGYYRPATATGYTKQRTGAMYPLQLNFDAIPGKIKQMLNDIAMHPAITEVGKILMNKDFKETFAQYYGKEYMKQLEPWLRDAAGQTRYDPGRLEGLETAVRFLQENMSTLLIGFNIFGTVPKHFLTATAFSMREVGAKRFADSMFHIFGETEQGITRWRNAMETSEEIQNRLRSMKESISATNQDLFKRYNWGARYFKARDFIQTLGAAPVAGSDFFSAIIMWDAAYNKFLEENPGASHGDAVYDANTAVRRTHGSTIITNRPAILRSNPYVNTFMPFYNFANNATNRAYEFATQAKLAMQGRTLPEMTGFEKETFEKGKKHIPEILGGLLVYGMLWSLIDQIVDPLPPDPDHPILQGSKMIVRGPANMVWGLRDIVNGAFGGHAPSAGIMGTAYQDIAKPLGEIRHITDPGKAFKAWNNAAGALTGLTYAPVGNVGNYINSIVTGREAPQDPLDIIRGYRYGTQRVRK